MTQRYWRDRAGASPAIPVGHNGGVPSDEEVFEWCHVHEQAEKEHERELQAKATAEELHDLIETARQEVDLAWIHTLKLGAQREIAKNPFVEASVADGAKRARPGRPPKGDDYRDMLREICTRKSKTDSEAEFNERLTRPGDGRKPLSKKTARYWFRKSAADLAKEKAPVNPENYLRDLRAHTDTKKCD
jgi:hypothetical protein